MPLVCFWDVTFAIYFPSLSWNRRRVWFFKKASLFSFHEYSAFEWRKMAFLTKVALFTTISSYFEMMQVACNYCGPSGVEGCFGGAQMVPSGKYYCITNQGAADLNYNCPYYTSLAYIRNTDDFEDWKFVRGKYVIKCGNNRTFLPFLFFFFQTNLPLILESMPILILQVKTSTVKILQIIVETKLNFGTIHFGHFCLKWKFHSKTNLL